MLKNELKNFLSGAGKTESKNLIHAIAGYLAASEKASGKTEISKLTKQEEAKLIIDYLSAHQFPNIEVDESRYLTEGAEQKIYLSNDGNTVVKLNSSIFYFNWSDYLMSLLIHNFFFPVTQYNLLGFIEMQDLLYAAVQQPYIVSNEITDVNKIKIFMQNNDFTLKKNNDYYSKSLGLIAEDLHDENVLTKDGVLFFIDTVFYITEGF